MIDIIDFINELPARIAVVLKNLLTYLVLAQTALTWAVTSGYLSDFPDYLQIATVAVGLVGAVITFVRRVTPVPVEEHGLI
jgi:hypothetical protein